MPGGVSARRRAYTQNGSKADPVSHAPVQFVYVDPQRGERPWGYRIFIRYVDVTRAVAERCHAKVYDHMAYVVSTYQGQDTSHERRVYSWIPARCMDTVEEHLIATGQCRSQRDWYYSQRSDGE